MSSACVMYEAALRWRARGYNVLPQNCGGAKYPAVRWKGFQEKLVTERELWQWLPLFGYGLGFVTGRISGIVVIETDGFKGQTLLDLYEQQYQPLPKTRVVQSGSHRGFHYHFRHPGNWVKSAANPRIKIDVKGDGGFCILPPSHHKSGGTYQLIRDDEPAPLPSTLMEFLHLQSTRGSRTFIRNPQSGV